MVDSLDPKPGFAFWTIGTVALLWNLIGVLFFVMQVSATPEQLAQAYSPEQAQMIESVPAWAQAMTGIATIAGVLGSALLLLRRGSAIALFAVSLIALIVQDIYTFVLTDTLKVFGTMPLIIQAVVIAIALFLLVYSRGVQARGLLR
jgi:ABC-type multidrug transport system permease subunit